MAISSFYFFLFFFFFLFLFDPSYQAFPASFLASFETYFCFLGEARMDFKSSSLLEGEISSSFESVNGMALASLYRYRDRMLKGLFSLGDGLSDEEGERMEEKERNARKEKKKRT
ncbi:hypothetical protein MAP00_002079 [Monascus purpureus]|nr:hypothetical protein MAP00_002079 [Monascus purpureus]